MSGEIFTREQVERYIATEVEEAGGPAAWLKKNKIEGFDPTSPLWADGKVTFAREIMDAVGFRPIERYEAFIPKKPKTGHN